MEADKVKNDKVDEFLKNINQTYTPKELPRTVKLVDIPQNLKYKIKSIKKLDTRYGEKILINIYLNDLVDYHTYLPDRYSKMTKPQIDFLCNNPEIYFVYEGKNASGIHQLKFTAE